MSNVSTKLIDATADQKYLKRKSAIVKAWQQWLHDIIAAMDAQRQHEALSDDMIVSGELLTLMAELDECRACGKILSHQDDDEAVS
jgi:hypothetical protein